MKAHHQYRRRYRYSIIILSLLSLVVLLGVANYPSLFASAAAAGESEAASSSDDASSSDRVCQATEDGGNTCNAEAARSDQEEETKKNNPPGRVQQQLQPAKAEFMNKSQYRVDVHWDDGRFGSRVGILEKGSDSKLNVDTYVGHSFFITKHGTRELLYDLNTDEPYRFTVETAIPIVNGFIINDKAGESTNPCQDRFSMCHDEAERGGCWSSPGWMIVHCCKSCDEQLEASKLIDRKVRCTKERLNITEPAWHPGDLNDLFIKWVTDPAYESLDPKVWSSPDPSKYGGLMKAEGSPWVITFDNFLTDEEVDALIEGGKIAGFERSTDQGRMNKLGEREKVVSKSRTSSNAWCTGACEELDGVKSATKRIEYVTSIPQTNYESYQILEYDKHQFYKMHHDSSSAKNDSPSGHRILTFFLYLSDVEVGGETKFNQLLIDEEGGTIEVTPKKGRALIWPSVRDDDPSVSDMRMYHEAKPVLKGKKYAANHWIHLNDYRGPNIWGCTGSFS